MAFGHVFLKIYDRKILSGETTFSRSGIRGNDFTQMCINPEYVMSEEALSIVCQKMPLTEEEKKQIYDAAGYEYQP